MPAKNPTPPPFPHPPVTIGTEHDGPLGPFFNPEPRMFPHYSAVVAIAVRTATPATVALSTSNPDIATVPASAEVWFPQGGGQIPPYVGFEVDGHAVGTTTLTATFGEHSLSTDVTVLQDDGNLDNLLGNSPPGNSAPFAYELFEPGMDANLVANMTAPVVGEAVITITSETPEVASVAEKVILPNGQNWPAQIPMKIHRVGTTLITATCRGRTIETWISVIPPLLRIASIEPQHVAVRKGDDVAVTITMSEETVREIAICLYSKPKIKAPNALIIPRGQRSGTFHFQVLDHLDTGEGSIGIRWGNDLMGVDVYSRE